MELERLDVLVVHGVEINYLQLILLNDSLCNFSVRSVRGSQALSFPCVFCSVSLSGGSDIDMLINVHICLS